MVGYHELDSMKSGKPCFHHNVGGNVREGTTSGTGKSSRFGVGLTEFDGDLRDPVSAHRKARWVGLFNRRSKVFQMRLSFGLAPRGFR